MRRPLREGPALPGRGDGARPAAVTEGVSLLQILPAAEYAGRACAPRCMTYRGGLRCLHCPVCLQVAGEVAARSNFVLGSLQLLECSSGAVHAVDSSPRVLAAALLL